MIAGGLQVIDVDGDSNTISAITSFRDPEIAVRCGFPMSIRPSE
jgi:hypothetical protein